jgi:hypothetical protein
MTPEQTRMRAQRRSRRQDLSIATRRSSAAVRRADVRVGLSGDAGHRPGRRADRRGSAAWGVVAALAFVLVLVALAALLLLSRFEAVPAAAGPAGAAESGTSATLPAGGTGTGAGRSSTSSTRAAERPLATRGRLRGGVQVPRGVAFPERWELHVYPSRYHDPGGAVERVLELTAAEREFELDDLPLGVYEVEPRAEGMNAYAVPAELVPTSAEVYVVLQLHPAGALSGQLLYEGGIGADGITMRLHDATGALVREATTDSAGRYRFEKLPDGEYELAYGEAHSPLFPAKSISFRAPSMHIPARIVPDIGQITFEVRDAAGNPVEGAIVTGSGSNGGTIDDVTGPGGRCTVGGLPAGDYRVWANLPGEERRLGRVTLRPGQHPICHITSE